MTLELSNGSANKDNSTLPQPREGRYRGHRHRHSRNRLRRMAPVRGRTEVSPIRGPFLPRGNTLLRNRQEGGRTTSLHHDRLDRHRRLLRDFDIRDIRPVHRSTRPRILLSILHSADPSNPLASNCTPGNCAARPVTDGNRQIHERTS